jgi:hypothetical protein
MTPEMLFGFLFGVAVIAGYVVLGIVCTRKTWQWSVGFPQRWMRVLLVSFAIVFFFVPGVMGAGHGAAIVPAWLMFASGTFQVLTTASKQMVLLLILGAWAVVFAAGLTLTREKVEK